MNENSISLKQKIERHFDLQYANWEFLRQGIDSLSEIKIKIFRFGGFIIKAQYNPRRIISTTAAVDEKSINNRKCFLCTENLPAEQLAVEYKNDLCFLCNPYPILPLHMTVASQNHTPQLISGKISSMIDAAKDLREQFCVFYNGPRCGASAPDHLHFQTGECRDLPIWMETDFIKENGTSVLETDAVSVHCSDSNLRSLIYIVTKNSELLINIFDIVYNALITSTGFKDEPLMNIAVRFIESDWHMIIFLREKHRPNSYHESGERRLVISPAVIDLCGCLIIPRFEDFEKITRDDIEKIYREVSLSQEKFMKVCALLSDTLRSL